MQWIKQLCCFYHQTREGERQNDGNGCLIDPTPPAARSSFYESKADCNVNYWYITILPLEQSSVHQMHQQIDL